MYLKLYKNLCNFLNCCLCIFTFSCKLNFTTFCNSKRNYAHKAFCIYLFVVNFNFYIALKFLINFGNTWELTDEQVEKVINIDLIGTWRTDKYATQYMLKQGFGRIINIASTSGLYGTPKLATYCMAKWGVLGLTKTLAKEVGSKGIIVNALCPTKVKTPMCETQSYVEFINELTGKNFKDYKEMYAGVPFLDVEDISDMVYWLGTSRAAGKFNGRDVALDLGTLQC